MNRRDKARSERLPYDCRAVAAVLIGGVRGEKREVERTGGGIQTIFKGSRGAAAALAGTGHFDSRFRRRQCVVQYSMSRAVPRHTTHAASHIDLISHAPHTQPRAPPVPTGEFISSSQPHAITARYLALLYLHLLRLHVVFYFVFTCETAVSQW
jgi:hypothetical protein